MLVITRRVGQSLFIAGDISVKVLGNTPGTVRLGIEAPPYISVKREELAAKSGEETFEKIPLPPPKGSCLTTLKQVKDKLQARFQRKPRQIAGGRGC